MRYAPHIFCFLVLGWTLLSSAQAQEAPVADPWQLAPEHRPTAPDVYLLPDQQGKLRRVLGFRYEDFLRAWNNKATEGNELPPRYVIDSLEISGQADDDQAGLRIELRVTTHENGWIDVPLKLPNLIVQKLDLGQKAAGECFVYDAQRQEHVVWLQGQAGQQRELEITGLAKVTSNAGKSELQISLPYATVSSMALSIPATNIELDASPGLQLTTSVANNQTEVLLRGYASPMRLHWSHQHEHARTDATTYESVGKLRTQIDRRHAQCLAQLTINSFGNPLDVLQVRLPDGVQNARVETPAEIDAVVTEGEDATGRVVEIRPQRPTVDPWTLQISAEQVLDEGDAESLCKVGGFEAVGAVRQSGRVELEIDEQLQAYFDLEGDLEQVPLDVSEGQSQIQPVTAAFAYSRFPWTLSVHTLPKQRRVNVQPRYDLQIDPEEARLHVEFDYQFSGARTFAVRVDLRGWELTDEPLESGGAVDVNRYLETQEGLLVMPLVNPDLQRARIALSVRKPLRLGEQTIDLPEALGGFVLPGELTVTADPSLQVTTVANSLEGLGAVTATEQVGRRDDSPLVFRTFLSRASLGAEINRRERQTAVDIHTGVAVEESQLHIQQELTYDVKYRPLSQLLLLVPDTIANSDSLEVLLDGKEVSVGLATDAESSTGQMIVSLPRPLQQTIQLEIAYDLPNPGVTQERPAGVSVPLVVPVDSVTSNEATVRTNLPLRASLSQSAGSQTWSVDEEDNSLSAGEFVLRLRTEGAQAILPLSVRKESLRDLQNAILERAWLQSWVTGNLQQDRAVFRFRSPHDQVYVELPSEVAAKPLEVLLDGQTVEFQRHAEGRISTALRGESPQERHVLEVRYQHPARLLSGAVVHTTLPRLVCRPMSAPVFWQLILPRGWQLVRSPEAMASEFWLGWKQMRWGRQATRSQADLQQWSGASIVPTPPPTTNQYLYSAFDVPPVVEVTVAHQVWLIGASTLAAFGIGLLCVYTPVASKVSFWLGLALVLLALLLAYPELALLVGQAVFWGGVMTLAVIMLRRSFVRHSDSQVVLTTSASSALSASATESWANKQRITSSVEDQPTVATHASGSNS